MEVSNLRSISDLETFCYTNNMTNKWGRRGVQMKKKNKPKNQRMQLKDVRIKIDFSSESVSELIIFLITVMKTVTLSLVFYFWLCLLPPKSRPSLSEASKLVPLIYCVKSKR
jgi:hypothetical protein